MTVKGRIQTATIGTLVAGALLAPAAVEAQSFPEPFAPYDGSNPFRCELQDVGTGTDFPHPDADPFCVKFDKTNQNVTDFGIVEFLAQEPTRLAAAGPKCFYYQQDEWTGSIVQGEDPELWHWNGGYFFNKAAGTGGVSVRQFRVGGVPFSAEPYVPEAYKPYFDAAGGGGVQFQYASNPGFGCAAMVDTPEERGEIFRDESVVSKCVDPGGGIRGRRIGAVALGSARAKVQEKLGTPTATKGRADTWCVTGGDYIQVVFAGKPSAAALIRTTVVGHAVRGIGVGSDAKQATRKLDLERLFKLGGMKVFEGAYRGEAELVVGMGARVRWLALVDPGALASKGALKRALASAS